MRKQKSDIAVGKNETELLQSFVKGEGRRYKITCLSFIIYRGKDTFYYGLFFKKGKKRH